MPPSSVIKCKSVRHKSPIRAVSQELVKWSTTTCRVTKISRKDVSKWAVDLENLSSEPDPRPSLSQRSHRGGMPLMEPTTFSLHERQLTDPLTLWVLGELGLSISLPPPPRLCSCKPHSPPPLAKGEAGLQQPRRTEAERHWQRRYFFFFLPVPSERN